MKSQNMLLIALFFAILISVITAGEETSNNYNNEKILSLLRENVTENSTTYERVLINGKWWIFVYENDRLVDVFVDPDED